MKRDKAVFLVVLILFTSVVAGSSDEDIFTISITCESTQIGGGTPPSVPSPPIECKSTAPLTALKMSPRTSFFVTATLIVNGEIDNVDVTLITDDSWDFMFGYDPTKHFSKIVNDTVHLKWYVSTPLIQDRYEFYLHVDSDQVSYDSEKAYIDIIPLSENDRIVSGISRYIYLEHNGDIIHSPFISYFTSLAIFQSDVIIEPLKVKVNGIVFGLVFVVLFIYVFYALLKRMRDWMHKRLYREHEEIIKNVRRIPVASYRFEKKKRVLDKYKHVSLKSSQKP